MVEPGEIRLPGQTGGDFGGMEPPGEDATGHTFEEPFQPPFETPNHIHRREGYLF